MTTKNNGLVFMNEGLKSNDDKSRKFTNFNLNQSNKCTGLLPVQSYSKSSKDNDYGKTDDKFDVENIHEKRHTRLERTSKYNLCLTTNYSNLYDKAENYWKNVKDGDSSTNTSNKSSSTLSLHIAAYENSVVVKSSKEKHKNPSKKSIPLYSLSKLQNPFEHPRQMNDNNDDSRKPEVMQFKSSQKLLSLNFCNQQAESSHTEQYIDKKTTQQAIFLNNYPEYDGRGVLIAVIDYQVDISLPTMIHTSTGKPKLFDIIDFTKYGKVDTSDIKKMNSDNMLMGMTGIELKIPSSWNNPSGNWHLGMISSYKLCSNEKFKKLSREEKATKRNKCKELDYFGLNVDVIVWYNGNSWNAVLDTSIKGELENCKILSSYIETREYGIFETLGEKFSYAFSINSDGNEISIFCSYDEHGTVVAQIAAGHFHAEQIRDGLAPGAQLVSMNVHAVSTSKKLNPFKSAIEKSVEMNVDIICVCHEIHRSDFDTIKELIKDTKIIVFCAAGNYGLYSSVQNIGNTSESIFIIGSVLTADMKNNIQKTGKYVGPPAVANHSSRGPLSNGAIGVDFVAPGAAITFVPQWKSLHPEHQEGTSFACPNAAGSIACVISALKILSIPYNPAMLKEALYRTAILPKNGSKLEFGNGIIQIVDAFNIFQSIDQISRQIFKVDGQICEGIIFIKKKKNEVSNSYTVKLNDKNDLWKKCSCVGGQQISSDLKILPENQKFLSCPDKLTKSSFEVKIKFSDLNHGIYGAQIVGSNALMEQLFSLPVTVIIPVKIKMPRNERELIMMPHVPSRNFILPPDGKKQCRLIIITNEKTNTKLYVRYSIEHGKKVMKTIDFDGGIYKKEFDLHFHSNDLIQIYLYHEEKTVRKFFMKMEFR